jgi:AcrR family transcriptional regulator
VTEATAASATAQASWTPNQKAARRQIIEAAADLVGEHGLSACTFRSVATRAGVTKSTVHYYFDDANELMDLSVDEVFQRVARYARESVLAAPDASAALEFMVRLFMGRGELATAFKFRESMLWPAYTAHAWKRGAKASILRELETLRCVFQLTLERAPMSGEDATARATSVHSYLTGAMVRNMVEPLDRDEIARAVSALSGLEIDPARC